MATCETKRAAVSYTLELTEAEAEAMFLVLCRVDGYAATTKRGEINSIIGAMYEACVPCYKGDKEPTGRISFT